jgi:hypothetical protein
LIANLRFRTHGDSAKYQFVLACDAWLQWLTNKCLRFCDKNLLNLAKTLVQLHVQRPAVQGQGPIGLVIRIDEGGRSMADSLAKALAGHPWGRLMRIARCVVRLRGGSGRCEQWIKIKGPVAPAVRRGAEEQWH